VIALYLARGTQSPISLLELGLFCQRGPYHKLIVCCPAGSGVKGMWTSCADAIRSRRQIFSLFIDDIRETFGFAHGLYKEGS